MLQRYLLAPLAALLIALLPLLAHAGTPFLTLQATVAAGAGVDATAFVDLVEVVDVNTGAVVASAVPNGGFETFTSLGNGNYGYNPAGATWVFTSNSGIATNGSAFGSATAPEGTHVAFLQSNGSGAGSFSQTLPALTAGLYQVRVQLAQRGSNTTPQSVRLLVDGTAAGTFTPASSAAYTSYLSTPFVVDAVLQLQGRNTIPGSNPDVTAFVDQVELLNVGAGTSVAVANPSFETTGSLGSGSYGYTPTGTGWVFAGNSGLATNGSAFGNPDAPAGTHVAFLQTGGTNSSTSVSFSQVVSTALVAGSYRVRLYGAQRDNVARDQVVKVLLNGREVGRFQPTLGFAQYTLPSATTSFTQLVAPVLTAVSPLAGVPGTVVSLTGAGLTNTTSITFTGAAGVKTVTSGFTVNAAGTQITGIVVPAGAQSGPVLATTPLGTSLVGPVLFSRVASLAVGTYHTVAVRADGSLWAWGFNSRSQLGLGNTTSQTSPTRVGTDTNWLGAVASFVHTLAVRADGSLYGWGDNAYGELAESPYDLLTSASPRGLGPGWASAGAGKTHSLALDADGRLWAWGDNTYGQLGRGRGPAPSTMWPVARDTTWVSAVGGEYHTLAVGADGSLWAWGYNGYGQLGLGNTPNQTSLKRPQRVGTATNWVSVATGFYHTLALQADGSLWAWGNNNSGQLGLGNTTSQTSPTRVGTATNWVSVAVGNGHSLALQADGSLWAWGNNSSGQLGLGNTTSQTSPTRVGTATNWVSVAAGGNHSGGEQSCRTVWGWGENSDGQVGDGSTTQRLSPVQVLGPTELFSIAPSRAGIGSTVTVTGTGLAGLTALSVNGADALASVTNSTVGGFSFVVPVGAAATGTVTVTTGCGSASSTAFVVVPMLTAVRPFIGVPGTVVSLTGTGLTNTTSIAFAGAGGVKTVTSGFTVNAAGTQITGIVVPAGARSGPVLATTTIGTSLVGPALFSRATSLATGGYHTVAVRADGSLWAWGRNDSGQLGLGSTSDQASPQRVGTATSWVSAAAGTTHTVAVRADGSLWAWGNNDYGQLGLGTTTSQTSPQQVGTATTWASAAAGGYHSLAVRADGTLWAWGDNDYGQLGMGTYDSQPSPTQVGAATSWVSAAAGGYHSLAVRADGTLWAWGNNDYGQLGLGNYAGGVTSPTQVGAATSWVSAAAGNLHTVAVQADGSLWAWGNNYYGQLGLGNTTNQPGPTQMGTATSWVSAATGGYHSLAVRADGTLWAWGFNGFGQLGQGNYTRQTSPAQVGTGTSWASAAAGGYHAAGEQSCRAAWAWGENGSGQVGDGSTTQRPSPVRVYNPVSLLSFTPNRAAVGSTVAVTGTGLAGLSALSVNGVDALASVTGLTDTGFSFVVPAGATATGTVTVAAGCGSASSLAFTVVSSPALTGLSPAAELPGMPVVLTGTGFTNGSTVSFGGVAAASVTYTSPTSLTAVVPAMAPAGSSAVVVGTPDGSSASSLAFTVLGVYDGGALAACAPAVPVTATVADGAWHYLLSSTGQVVLAYNYTGATLGSFAADVLRADPASPVRQDGAGHKYLDRNWHLTTSGGPFAGRAVQLRFYGLTSELARLQAADGTATLSNLKATQYSGANEDCTLGNDDFAGGEFRSLAAPASTPGNGVGWFMAQVSVADHFSEFYLTGSAAPLPVELVTFTAVAEGAGARLRWTTASEQNSAAFEVERSADGLRFERIGTVAAAGSSSTVRRYELLDARLPAGTAVLYYRLRQVDLDGTARYSPVRTVQLTGAAAGLTLFPNPNPGGTVTLTGAAPSAVVTVLDALGRVVTMASADAVGTAVLALPAGLASGVYVVRTGQQALRLTVTN